MVFHLSKNENMIHSIYPETKQGKRTNPEEPENIIRTENKTAGKSQKEMKTEYYRENKNLRYRSLVIESAKYRTLYNRKFENRKKWVEPDHRKILSYIPGTVVKICIAPGQEVQEGETILILEAMKMKNRLVFSESGRIKAVYVSEGEKVPKNHLMVELE